MVDHASHSLRSRTPRLGTSGPRMQAPPRHDDARARVGTLNRAGMSSRRFLASTDPRSRPIRRGDRDRDRVPGACGPGWVASPPRRRARPCREPRAGAGAHEASAYGALRALSVAGGKIWAKAHRPRAIRLDRRRTVSPMGPGGRERARTGRPSLSGGGLPPPLAGIASRPSLTVASRRRVMSQQGHVSGSCLSRAMSR